jgi:hypothetical protein
MKQNIKPSEPCGYLDLVEELFVFVAHDTHKPHTRQKQGDKLVACS